MAEASVDAGNGTQLESLEVDLRREEEVLKARLKSISALLRGIDGYKKSEDLARARGVALETES